MHHGQRQFNPEKNNAASRDVPEPGSASPDTCVFTNGAQLPGSLPESRISPLVPFLWDSDDEMAWSSNSSPSCPGIDDDSEDEEEIPNSEPPVSPPETHPRLKCPFPTTA